MKPEDLIRLAREVDKREDAEWREIERKERLEETRKRKQATVQAKKDINRAISYIEKLVGEGLYREDKNHKRYYELDNHWPQWLPDGVDKGAYFYDSNNRVYWKELCNYSKKLGYKVTLDVQENEVFDSMSTYTTYSLIVRL